MLSLQNKTFCINSQIVERLDIIQQKQYQTVFRCGVSQTSEFQDQLVPWIYSLQKILPQFEAYFPEYGKFPQRVRIVITKDVEETHWVSSQAIYISESLVQNKKPLLEDLSFILLKSRFPEFSDLTITFLAKLFYKSQFDHLLIQDLSASGKPTKENILSMDQISDFVINQIQFLQKTSLRNQFYLPGSILKEPNHFDNWVVNRFRPISDSSTFALELSRFKKDLQNLMQKSDFFRIEPERLDNILSFIEDYYRFQLTDKKRI